VDENGEEKTTPAHGVITVQETGKPVYYTIRTNEDLTGLSKENLVRYVKAVLAYETSYETVEQEQKTIQAEEAVYATDKDRTLAIEPTLALTGDNDQDETIIRNYYYEFAREAVRKDYEENSYNRVGFLWIKNIWNVDASYEHPLTAHDKMLPEGGKDTFDVNGTEVDFTNIQKYSASPYSELAFKEITTNLTDAKESPNGYFILIALSIGTILLQQFITMRSQKAQNKYSSVDGQQASTQKTTMIIMTVMFGIFAFMYSAAFSTYMVISNVFSMLSTMVINKIVDVTMSKKEEKAMKAKMNRTLPGKANAQENASNTKKEKKNK
jgi:hypothetical protein